MLTHRILESNALIGRFWLRSGEHEVVHGVLSLFHAFGLTLGVTFAMSLGARLGFFPTGRADSVLGAMKRARPTVLPAVPRVYQKLLDAAPGQGLDLRGIPVAVSGAMSLPVPLVERWERATGGLLIEGYVLTECSPLVACNPLNGPRGRGPPGSGWSTRTPSRTSPGTDPGSCGCGVRRSSRGTGSAPTRPPGRWRRTGGWAPATSSRWTTPGSCGWSTGLSRS
ncbi:UNVERIFIED_CONTAM: AMP-binding protein [Kocuria sp. CPCC 205315]